MALNPDFLRQVQSQYDQQMNNQRGPMGDAAFDDGSNIKTRNSNLSGGLMGAAGLAVTTYGAATRNNNINTNAPTLDTDPYGRPNYNLGNFSAQTDAINTKVSGGNIANSTVTGAAAGTAIAPGIGTAIGAIGGAIIGTAGELFASGAAKRKKRLAQQSLLAAQQSYNTHMLNYNNIQAGEDKYQELLNPESRMYSIYKATTPY